MPGQFPRAKFRANPKQKCDSHLLNKLRFFFLPKCLTVTVVGPEISCQALGWFWML